MAKAKRITPQSIQEKLAQFFLGRTITAIDVDDNGITLATDAGTLSVGPTRFETVSATLGRKVTEDVPEPEAMEFMAGKTIKSTEPCAGSTIIRFANEEAVVIGATPDVQTDTRPTYTITRVVEEELI
jgi:hypothetical protein